MTRPGIVRADTLDLQDQDSPSTQDHSKRSPVQHADFSEHLVGAHQAAEVRHVMEERHTEEQNLQGAWGSPRDGEDIRSRTDDMDGVDGEDMRSTAESDADTDAASDDDMMDRISSSPSIDDGAYRRRSPQWPARSSSLTPTRNCFARSPSSAVVSSPFVEEPVHFPLLATGAGVYDSPASTQQSSSPYSQSPLHLPLWVIAQENKHPLASRSHHQVVSTIGTYSDDEDDDVTTRGQPHRYGAPRDALYGENSNMSQVCLHVTGENDEREMPAADFTNALLPAHDPLLEAALKDRSPSPTESACSWTTVSDVSADHDMATNLDEFDDDYGDLSFYSDDRFVDSGWGGECLQDTEDIDFDFVYALHTFVATVEGQANATKGDTMVLLDDTNSYWWLVRVVKDSSIGYLPAEHIETPTERLARLNKHRNVDLSAAMLGDNAERSKNPLKKAIRRRNTKNVQFGQPTYVEASDYEYSSEEEDGADSIVSSGMVNGQSTQTSHEVQTAPTNGEEEVSVTDPTSPTRDMHAPEEEPVGSPKLVDQTEAAPLKSRKGNPRNSDSWLRDLKEENGVTKRISLTPHLLRDEGTTSRTTEIANSSTDSLEKTISPSDKPKEEKKKKEKKSGMLSGLFKSSKKKAKEEEKTKKKEFVSDEEVKRVSSDTARHSAGSLPDLTAKSKEAQPASQQKKGKLTKAAPGTSTSTSEAKSTDTTKAPDSAFVAELEGSQVAHEAPTGLEEQIVPPRGDQVQRSVSKGKTKKAKTRQALDDFDEDEDDLDDSRDVESSHLADDDVDESMVSTVSSAPTFMHGTEAVHIPMQQGDMDSSDEELHPDEDESEEARGTSSTPPSLMNPPQEVESKHAESEETVQHEEPMQQHTEPFVEHKEPPAATTHVQPVEPVAYRQIESEMTEEEEATPTPSKPQSPLLTNNGPHSIPFVSHTPPPPEEPMMRDSSRQASQSSTVSSRNHLSPSPASSNTTWSDAGLKAWLDGDNDIRDMLVIIHDKSNVKPVAKTHPLMAGLFAQETKTLEGLSNELDDLLRGIMQRGTGASAQTQA
ncbi:hypothetical protein MBLNU457_5888t2 [Dothideomycetes sp. NU457]